VILRLGVFYFFPISLQNNQPIHFSAVLLEDPKVVGNSQQFHLRYGGFWQSTNLLIATNTDTEFAYGQTLEIAGSLKERLLKNKQTVLTIQNPEIKAKNEGFLPIFGSLRQRIIDFCENNFSQPYSGLIVGIIFGVKSLLTYQITTSFRITGLSHIVAASGMNVTLIAGFLFAVFAGLLKRRGAIVASILGIFVYVALSGFQPSILRAAFMGAVAFSAGFFGRQYSGIYILFLVGSGMLLCDPLLLSDVGFQLSVLATFGIVVVQPILFKSNIFGEDFGTTLAAQLTTLPILLATFGQYSLLSIVANLLVLWTIPLIMTIGGIGILVGLVVEPVGKLIVCGVIPLLWYLEKVTAFFAGHSATIHIDSLPLSFLVGYYLLLLGIVLFFQKKRERIQKS
ncbi:MAG TPA: ComEC/Rec2 family competence protein, partial [Candidatus Eisenbacteria bacterium]|nr:ComEC/Rec2 family competence protein [Candidatus Eisenbacteria bacterium]